MHSVKQIEILFVVQLKHDRIKTHWIKFISQWISQQKKLAITINFNQAKKFNSIFWNFVFVQIEKKSFNPIKKMVIDSSVTNSRSRCKWVDYREKRKTIMNSIDELISMDEFKCAHFTISQFHCKKPVLIFKSGFFFYFITSTELQPK